jgi:small redox-active disulfide protein 2
MALSHENKLLDPTEFSFRREKMEIRILGAGCPRCNEVEKRTMNVLADLGVAADVQKVKDIKEIAKYGAFGTPGLVINGKVKSYGRIPSLEEIKAWIQQEK